MPVSRADYLIEPPADPDSLLRGLTLPDVFAVAGRDPDEIAITDAARSLTWRQWRLEVDAVACGLQATGVRPGDVVAVQLPNCIDYETLHLAIAAVGAVLLPVHLANGSAEVLALLDRVRPAIVVLPPHTQRDQGGQGGQGGQGPLRAAALRAAFPFLRAVVISRQADGHEGTLALDELRARWFGHSPQPVELTPDMPFVLLPSSGTTSARPKICLHSQDGLLSNAAAALGEDTGEFGGVVMAANPLTHLFGLQSMWSALLTSSPQALLSSWDLDRFLELARRVNPAVLFAVPAQLHDLALRLRTTEQPAVLRLRQVWTAGAAVPAALTEEISEALGASVAVFWGMSEIGHGTHTRLSDPPEVAVRSVGCPVRGSAVRIMDADGAPCAPGVPGELQFRGAGMFRGYYGEPELTRTAITADGWLRTGDAAARGPDGLVTFHGRSGELINVGGQKFSASEIANLLAELPGLGPLAVVGKADPRLGEYACLVITTALAGPDDLARVTGFLRDRGVAEYKIPLEVVTVDEIPRTPAGKLDRRALEALVRPAAEAESPGAAGADKTPASFDEALALVRECVARLLSLDGPEAVKPEVTFRSQGINSLLAIRLGTALADATGLPIPGSLAFDFPTPAAAARLLIGETGENGANDAVPAAAAALAASA